MATLTETQVAIIQKRGFLCNLTGGHCPRGCATPCTYEVKGPDGAVTKTDYNTKPACQ